MKGTQSHVKWVAMSLIHLCNKMQIRKNTLNAIIYEISLQSAFPKAPWISMEKWINHLLIFVLLLFHLTVNVIFFGKYIQKYPDNLYILFLLIFDYQDFFLILVFINNWRTLLRILIVFNFWQRSHVDPSNNWIKAIGPLPIKIHINSNI